MGAKFLWWLYGNFYDGLRSFYPYRQLVHDVARELKAQPGQVVLDVGCGTGNVLAEISELRCHLIGIDGSKSMLARARRKLRAADASVLQADVVSFVHDHQAHSVDRIVLCNIIYTLPASARKVFWPAALGLLRRGGSIVIANPDRAGSGALIREHLQHDKWWRLLNPRLIGVWIIDKLIDVVISRGSFELISAGQLVREIESAGGSAKIVGRTYGGKKNGIDVLIVATAK